MQMSDAQLAAFKVRCLTAQQRGYSIARAGEYAKTLAAEVDLDLPTQFSAGDLADLASAVLKVRAGGGKVTRKVPRVVIKATPQPKASKTKSKTKATKADVFEEVQREADIVGEVVAAEIAMGLVDPHDPVSLEQAEKRVLAEVEANTVPTDEG